MIGVKRNMRNERLQVWNEPLDMWDDRCEWNMKKEERWSLWNETWEMWDDKCKLKQWKMLGDTCKVKHENSEMIGVKLNIRNLKL